MMIVLEIQLRKSADGEPEKRKIAVRPEFIGLIEEAPLVGPDCVAVYVEGKDSPYIVTGTVDEIVEKVNQ